MTVDGWHRIFVKALAHVTYVTWWGLVPEPSVWFEVER